MKTKVAIIRGGPTSEYHYSIKNGAAIAAFLPEEQYSIIDIFIDSQGTWHARGIPMPPVTALQGADVVINAVFGGMGEDGTIARIVKQIGVPYIGSDPIASARAFNKARARDELREAGLSIPQGRVFSLHNGTDARPMAEQIFAQFGPPYIVKPVNEGRSQGVCVVPTIRDLPVAIAETISQFGAALVEEYVRGDHIRASVVRDLRNDPLYVFPIAHARLPEGSRIIMPEHYASGGVDHDVPSRHTPEHKRAIEDVARRAHEALDLGALSHVDIIHTPRKDYVLEVDTTIDLLPQSPVVLAMQAVGVTPTHYLEHLIQRARPL